jgi:hypothetical protein
MKRNTNAELLKQGDILSEVQYYTVKGREVGYVNLENERGMGMRVANAIVQEGMYSANQFDKEVEVTRTEIVDIMSQAGDTVFTVNFNAKVKDEDMKAQLETLYPNKGKILSKTEFNDAVKNITKFIKVGRERTLKGRLISTVAKFGRFQVIDLEIKRNEGEWDNRIRQVDQETINWLILRNVRYFVKK